jgi:hypothetical protein
MTALTVDDGIDTLTKARDAVGGDASLIVCLVGSELEDVHLDLIRVVRDECSRYVELQVNHPGITGDHRTGQLIAACKAAHLWLREYHTQMGSPMDEGVLGLFDQLEIAIAGDEPDNTGAEFGRCDTCNAECDCDGCTENRSHNIAN